MSDGVFIGPWYAWWSGDPLPDLPPLPGFTAAPAHDDNELAALAGTGSAEVAARRYAGNYPYIARLDGEAVAYGWVSERTVAIGPLGVVQPLAPGERYLWDFVTLERWRGRGIYPHLLQAILRHKAADTTSFWIGHTPGNAASARGILKAGFGLVGPVYRLPDGHLELVPTGPIARARRGATLLGAVVRGDDGRDAAKER